MKKGLICLCFVLTSMGCQQGAVDSPSNDFASVKKIGGDLLWQQHGSRMSFTPLIYGDDLLWAALDGTLSTLNSETGEVKTRETISGGIAVTPNLRGSNLFLITRTGDIVAYDVSSKSERWRRHLPAKTSGEPALAADLILIPLLPHGVCAINIQNGEIVWQIETDGLSASPIVDGDNLYLGTNTGFLLSIDIETGTEKWRYNLDSPITHRAVVINENVIVVAGKSVVAFSKSSGKSAWNFALPKNGSTAPVMAGNFCLVGTSASQVFAVNAASGQLEWGVRGDGSIIDIIEAAEKGGVIVGSRGRTLSHLDTKNGDKIWEYTGNGWFSVGPASDREKIIAADNAGVLHSIVY